MPRYYFDFRNGPRAVVDHVGQEFPGQGATLQEAMLTARDAITGIRLGLRHYGGWTLEVRDDTGRVIHAVPIPKTAVR